MTSLVLYSTGDQTLVCTTCEAPPRYSLQAVARLSGVHPEMLRYYCRLGLIDGVKEVEGVDPTFDDVSLGELRRIEHYRRDLGVQRRALPLLCDLWRESERCHLALAFLRAP